MLRVIIGAIVLIHGLAHAALATWANDGPLWSTLPLWGIAMLGYQVAGFGLMGIPVLRIDWRYAILAATAASTTLVTLFGHSEVKYAVILDLAILALAFTLGAPPAKSSPAPAGDAAPRFPRFVAAARLLATLLVIYGAILVPFRVAYLTWGSRVAERSMSLPGDDLVFDARYVVNHAITINAPRDSIWPWLTQLGQDRGGFYSHDVLERVLGDDVHSADRIHPEWQKLERGDLVRAAQPGYLRGILGDSLGWRVLDIVPGRALVLGNWGAFVLLPIDDSTTRLIIRTRGEGRPTAYGALLSPMSVYVFEPAHFIMQTQMLRGIKRRSEAMKGERDGER